MFHTESQHGGRVVMAEPCMALINIDIMVQHEGYEKAKSNTPHIAVDMLHYLCVYNFLRVEGGI